jgi:hypothetical protein
MNRSGARPHNIRGRQGAEGGQRSTWFSLTSIAESNSALQAAAMMLQSRKILACFEDLRMPRIRDSGSMDNTAR